MELELSFNGSPAEFGVMAHLLAVELWRDRKHVPRRVEVFEVHNWEYVSMSPMANPVVVGLWGLTTATEQIDQKIRVIPAEHKRVITGEDDSLTELRDEPALEVPNLGFTITGHQFAPLGRVEAHTIAGDQSRLRVIVPDLYWSAVEPYWAILHDKMKQQGRIIPDQSELHKASLGADADVGQVPTGMREASSSVFNEPERAAPLDDWIIWWFERNIRYYESGRRGHRPTLKEVAAKAGRSCNSVNVHKTRDPNHKFSEHKKRLSATRSKLK
jgi:hypothetical protein